MLHKYVQTSVRNFCTTKLQCIHRVQFSSADLVSLVPESVHKILLEVFETGLIAQVYKTTLVVGPSYNLGILSNCSVNLLLRSIIFLGFEAFLSGVSWRGK